MNSLANKEFEELASIICFSRVEITTLIISCFIYFIDQTEQDKEVVIKGEGSTASTEKELEAGSMNLINKLLIQKRNIKKKFALSFIKIFKCYKDIYKHQYLFSFDELSIVILDSIYSVLTLMYFDPQSNLVVMIQHTETLLILRSEKLRKDKNKEQEGLTSSPISTQLSSFRLMVTKIFQILEIIALKAEANQKSGRVHFQKFFMDLVMLIIDFCDGKNIERIMTNNIQKISLKVLTMFNFNFNILQHLEFNSLLRILPSKFLNKLVEQVLRQNSEFVILKLFFLKKAVLGIGEQVKLNSQLRITYSFGWMISELELIENHIQIYISNKDRLKDLDNLKFKLSLIFEILMLSFKINGIHQIYTKVILYILNRKD